MSTPLFPRRIGRRSVLAGLGAATGLAATAPWRPVHAALPAERRIRLLNIHTGETINTVYRSPEGYNIAALDSINHVLRDFRTGDVHPISPALLDLVTDLSVKLGATEPFDVISGYRSPATNGMLAAHGSGIAKKSYHTKGMAIDLALPRRDIRDVHHAAKELRMGGVGLYLASGFVHVDVGPVRSW